MTRIISVLALSENPLCPRCLGRCFARLGHGLTNEERGIITINYLKDKTPSFMGLDEERKEQYTEFYNQLLELLKNTNETEEPVEQTDLPGNLDNIAPDDCWLCEGISGEFDDYSRILARELEGYEFENLLVGSKIDETIIAREEALWAKVGVAATEPIKAEVNREVGKRLNDKLGKPTEFSNPEIVAVIDSRFNVGSIQPSPVFFYGRYKKLQRGLPQTRWHCKDCRGKGCSKCNGTGKMYETSVEELIGETAKAESGADEFYLHGMGREDIDVLMLGNGRPFVLELSRPRRRILNLEELGKTVNEKNRDVIEILGLRGSSREEMIAVKMSKSYKTYRCNIICESTISNEKLKMVVNTFVEMVISQKTPIRVAHRRADKTRMRKVADIRLDSMSDRNFAVDIKAESGLYIKELIHGDSGRTQPNISDELGVKCEVKTLDVIEIHDDDWEYK